MHDKKAGGQCIVVLLSNLIFGYRWPNALTFDFQETVTDGPLLGVPASHLRLISRYSYSKTFYSTVKDI